MIRRLLALMSVFLLAFVSPTPAASGPVYRALLIGCDEFLTHDSTAPSARMNVERIARLLDSDARKYARITRMDLGLGSRDALAEAAGAAFSDASDRDVSLIYICTHGLYDRITLEPLLILSDGRSEESISALQLQHVLDQIPGKKILILDACNSGAFIGKGEIRTEVCHSFIGPDYLVLTSAGAYEDSFLWHDRGTAGGSYFAQELCEGLRSGAFDPDKDGIVTLSEACTGMLECHGASGARAYPEDSREALYVYDPQAVPYAERPLGDIVLDNTVLSGDNNTLYFSYTVRRPVQVQYQLIYYRGGEWRFDAPQISEDSENADGALLPGRKQRSLVLSSEDSSDSGYVLLQIVAREGRNAMLAGSRLISVQRSTDKPDLRIVCPPSFLPEQGEELPVSILHAFPCTFTVRISDSEGNTVRTLAFKKPSRPSGERQDISFFCWDGRGSDGKAAAPGEYTLSVTCTAGGTVWTQTGPTVQAGSDPPSP